jgi:hypothetical protein
MQHCFITVFRDTATEQNFTKCTAPFSFLLLTSDVEKALSPDDFCELHASIQENIEGEVLK